MMQPTVTRTQASRSGAMVAMREGWRGEPCRPKDAQLNESFLAVLSVLAFKSPQGGDRSRRNHGSSNSFSVEFDCGLRVVGLIPHGELSS
jgi:hypothetical protein